MIWRPLALLVLTLTLADAALAQDLKPGNVRRNTDGRLFLDTSASANTPPPGRTLSVCPSGCDHPSLGAAVQRAGEGDLITVGPGLYREAVVVRVNHLTIQAEPGAHLQGQAAEGKAALVIKGSDTVIEGLECSDIAVPDQNGACIRLEGPGLTLRRVYFHDSEQGLLCGLSTGTITIEDSRFERLGGGAGHAHGLYVGKIDSFILRRSQVLASRDQGHEVKSRARQTLIEDSVIASLDGFDSRLIDVPNGGEVVIRNSVLEKGVNSVNQQVIGFGLEGIAFADNSLRLENTVVLLDRPTSQLIAGAVQPVLVSTRVVGGEKAGAGTAQWFATRQAAGLQPYPSLLIR